MKMPAPTMPAPSGTDTTPDTGFEYADKTLPRRRLKPGAMPPQVTLWRSVDAPPTQYLARLGYNGTYPCAVRPTPEMARDAAEQFYMHHTAQGRADSEPEQ